MTSDSATDVLAKVEQTIRRYELLRPKNTVVVAVSGGPDSLCLLHALRTLRERYLLTLHVAHLNHCLRGEESDADAQFVQDLAERWELPATVRTVDVFEIRRQRRGSLEETARQVRYAFLRSVASAVGADRVAVGHNADDQTETVLMHWLRGAGLAGLRGMLPKSSLDDLRLGTDQPSPSGMWLIRPLLYVTRAEIEAYCRHHRLVPHYDLSNLDTTYFRNRLRHELIPFLEKYNPNIREVVRRTAEVISADYAVLHAQVERAWQEVARRETEDWIALDLAAWRTLPLGLQRSTLRLAIQKLRRHLRDIGWEHVENALWIARERETGARATLPDGLMLTVDYDEIIVSDTAITPDAVPPYPWMADEEVELALPGITLLGRTGWSVTATLLPTTGEHLQQAECNVDPRQAFLDADQAGRIVFRKRRAGDRFQPLGMGHKSKSLREFMINAKIPERWRDLIPIAVTGEGEDIVWVVGWRIDERFKVTPATRNVLHLQVTGRRRGRDVARDPRKRPDGR